jgi:peptidoglycan/LPS O-acetylase OafA/YrhL
VLADGTARTDNQRMGHSDEEALDAPDANEEERRLAKAVMAGSIGPQAAGWLFHYEPFARNPRRARRILVFVVVVEAILLGFFWWALSSGHDAVMAYFLLAVMGLSIVTLPVSRAVGGLRSRRRRGSSRS